MSSVNVINNLTLTGNFKTSWLAHGCQCSGNKTHTGLFLLTITFGF